MAFENAASRTGSGAILLALDRSVKDIFSKLYWTGVALEINNRGWASLRMPRPVNWTAKV